MMVLKALSLIITQDILIIISQMIAINFNPIFHLKHKYIRLDVLWFFNFKLIIIQCLVFLFKNLIIVSLKIILWF